MLTNNLSVTVGGTLSIAGIGVASFRYGAQADNVEELEVATVDGTVHRCSRHEKADLFWGVLSGLGQIAVILQARLRLRKAKPMTRTYYLLYDDHRRFLEDARAAMESGRWDYIESWCAPSLQGFKWVRAGGSRSRAGSSPPTSPWSSIPPPRAQPGRVAGGPAALRDAPRGRPAHPRVREPLVPVFDLWKKLGTWEHHAPVDGGRPRLLAAAEFLDTVMPDLSPGVQVGGSACCGRHGLGSARSRCSCTRRRST